MAREGEPDTVTQRSDSGKEIAREKVLQLLAMKSHEA